MAIINEKIKYVDVLCQHKKDGKIIPIKIRVIDEDGENQTFQIKAYKDLTHYKEATTADYLIAENHIRSFECKILVFDCYKTIELFYNTNEQRWRITHCS